MWKKYCALYWSFVKQVGITKAMFNLTDAGFIDKGNLARHGDNIYDYWVSSMPSSLYNTVKIGFTGYPSAQYPWTWDLTVKGQSPDNCNPKKGNYMSGPSPLRCSPYKQGAAGVKQPGCPNNMEQMINYIVSVNNKQKIKGAPLISFVVIDGEGEGYSMNRKGLCPLISAIKAAKALPAKALPANFTAGIAHGPGNFCPDSTTGPLYDSSTCGVTGLDTAYPEIYWFGELEECAAEIGKSKPGGFSSNACTHTIYQDYINKPTDLLDALTSGTGKGTYLGNRIDHTCENDTDCSSRYGDTHWTCMDGQCAYNKKPSNIYQYSNTYPMFSLENVNSNSYKMDTKTNLYPCGQSKNSKDSGSGQCCIANYFSGEAYSCGSFNGFGNWDLDSFMEFLNDWSIKFDSPSVAIYEWAFVPTSWIKEFGAIMKDKHVENYTENYNSPNLTWLLVLLSVLCLLILTAIACVVARRS
jgi:hypothetical protein